MGLRNRLHLLTTVEEVDQFLKKYSTCAFFKAGGCHKTMQGFGYVEEAFNPRNEIPMGLVKVIENRPASNHIAAITQVVHQSPQVILIKNGEVVYDVDNWDITLKALETALLTHFGPIQEGNITSSSPSQLQPYVELLEKYVGDELDEGTFTQRWLKTFQMDSSLRSTKEFNLLNSLFGDVDEALSSHPLQGLKPPCKGHDRLKKKAASLLQQLCE